MLNGSITNRYTLALYNAAKDKGQVAEIDSALQTFVQVMTGTAGFRDFLASPLVDVNKRIQLITGTFGQSMPQLLTNFINVLLERGRIEYMGAVQAQFRKMVEDAQNEVSVQIESAQPLAAPVLSTLEAKLGEVLKKRTKTQASVRPELIAGIRVRIGHRVVDATVKGELDRFRRGVLAGLGR